MKKILVVLLVLAVAGGVFAQEGSWSLNGKVEIGSYIDFDNVPDKDVNDEPAIVRSSGYWTPYDYYGLTTGTFGINYSLGGLSAGLAFDAIDDAERLAGQVDYDGENFKFQSKADVQKLMAGTANVKRLWGYYKLLNEMIHLEVAYNSRDTETIFWTSDTAAGFFLEGQFNSPIVNVGQVWYNMPDIAGSDAGDPKNNNAFRPNSRNSFTHNDHGNYLLASVDLENLSFGVLIPRLFWDNYGTHDNAMYPKYGGVDSADPKDRDYANDAKFPKATYWGDFGTGGALLVDDVLKHMVFGVKFQMQPIEFAAQLLMDDYSVYFGGRVYFGALTVGASFMGIMYPTDENGDRIDATIIRVGGSLDYSADAFGAGLQAWYGIEGEKAAGNFSQIGFEPYFFYNVIPTHLQFRADVGFYFNNAYNGTEKVPEYSNIIWGFQPQLFWNFLGTGAGTYYGINTGMIVRYRMLKEANNALDVTFRLAF